MIPIFKANYRLDWWFFPLNYIDLVFFFWLYILGQILYITYIQTPKIVYRFSWWMVCSFGIFFILMELIEQKTRYIFQLIYYNLLHIYYLLVQ